MGSIDSQAHDADVIIIGGGISGCGAAWYLKQHGLSSIILEACDRVGGKTYTVPDGCGKSGHVDLGASWVNDTTQSSINALIEEFGLERLVQNTEGSYIQQAEDGSFFTHGLHEKLESRGDGFDEFLAKFRDVVESTNTGDVASTPGAEDLDACTIRDWVEKNFPGLPQLPHLVDLFARTVVGTDTTEASMLYFAHYFACGGGIKEMCGEEKHDAQYQRLVDGTQSISNAITARLPHGSVLLNHAVSSISQDVGSVTVKTKNDKTFTAKKAIITVTPPLWNSIQWSPKLSERKPLISDNLIMPTYSKIVFAFSSGWWRPKLSSGIMFADEGLVRFVRDTSVPAKDCWTLTCFATGKKGTVWGGQSREKRRTTAWEAMKSAFAQFVDDVPEPVSVSEMLWERHEYFWGAPSSSWPPGMLSKGFQKDLKAPHGNVHFAGSETSSAYKGFMEGGLRAAHRAVEEIVKG